MLDAQRAANLLDLPALRLNLIQALTLGQQRLIDDRVSITLNDTLLSFLAFLASGGSLRRRARVLCPPILSRGKTQRAATETKAIVRPHSKRQRRGEGEAQGL